MGTKTIERCGLFASHHCSVIAEQEGVESSNWSNRWKAHSDILRGENIIYMYTAICALDRICSLDMSGMKTVECLIFRMWFYQVLLE